MARNVLSVAHDTFRKT